MEEKVNRKRKSLLLVEVENFSRGGNQFCHQCCAVVNESVQRLPVLAKRLQILSFIPYSLVSYKSYVVNYLL